MRLLQPRMGRLPDGVHYSVSSNNVPLMPFSENFIYCFLISFLSQSWSSWFRTLNSASEKWVSLAAFYKAGGAGSSFTRSPFPLWKKSQAKQVTQPWAVLPWGRADASKVKLFFYPLQFLALFFFLQQSAGTSPAGNRDFHKSSLVPLWVTAQVSVLQVLRPTAKRGWNWFTGYCSVHSWY